MEHQAWYSTAAKLAARLSGRPATATTIIAFLMVFLIQNTQNRDTGTPEA